MLLLALQAFSHLLFLFPILTFLSLLYLWDGDYLTIPIDEADSEPLVGMSLMEGYQLTVQVFEEGSVEIRKVSAV
jgi:hypothetical protein